MLSGLHLGFSVALASDNLLYCMFGALIGTIVGILPGVGPVTSIAMLLPLTFKMSPTEALIMLSGIYYGAHHAGSTTAIMLNMPGEPSSIVICLDGHQMARQGRAGPALCIAAISSFFAGFCAIIVITLFSPLLSKMALSFGAPEYASLILAALVAVAALSAGPPLASLPMVVLGGLLATIGTDVNSGMLRFTFGLPDLADGLDFVTVAVGLFGIAEIALRMGVSEPARVAPVKIRGLLPTLPDLRASWRAILRGTGLGAVLGILPGTGPLISSFASYAIEKQCSKTPERFGTGAIEGVAGPEAANNASALTHFIPMLTLGVPAGAAMALMLGAMIIQGITPGPNVINQHPDLFWGIIASMFIGNFMLLILNLPLVGIWIRLLMMPNKILYPGVLTFCCIGVYSIQNSPLDVVIAAAFGVVGYILRKIGCHAAPLVLGFVLEPIFEENVRRALLISRGNLAIFVTHPISCGFLFIAFVLLLARCARLRPGRMMASG